MSLLAEHLLWQVHLRAVRPVRGLHTDTTHPHCGQQVERSIVGQE